MTKIAELPMKTGRPIPIFGFGTWRLNGEACTRSVVTALEVGYRHVDTADGYGNHREVGAGIRESGVPRQEIFLTSKVGRDDLHYDDLIKVGERALEQLQVDYLDLFLVHWPNNDIPMEETFRAMRQLLDDGRIRAVGVSNFTKSRLERALALNAVPISNNQVEYHALLNQKELHRYCTEQGVTLTAYSPLAQGKIGENAEMNRIAQKYGKSPEQIALRWLTQKQIVAIPKASSRDHIVSNLHSLDFELSPEDMQAIESIKEWNRLITWEVAEFDKE